MDGNDLATSLTKKEQMVISFVESILANPNTQQGSDPNQIVDSAILVAEAVISKLSEVV